MNYLKHHNLIIARARSRLLEGYNEKHHVVPKCLGGNDDADNLVRLTAEEHYVIHQLLVKIYPNKSKLIFAAHRMTSGNKRNNKLYGWVRRKHAETMSNQMMGKPRPDVSAALKGRKQSIEAIRKRIIGMTGKQHPSKWKETRISGVTYSSRTEAAKILDVNIGTIMRWLKNGKAQNIEFSRQDEL